MREVAGVAIPDSPLCEATTAYARALSKPFLFNHVMRTYLFGCLVGDKAGLPYDRELFYIAAVLHDLGLNDEMPANDRFEVEGADAAKVFLSRQGMKDVDIERVWDAIALHTTLTIPQRKAPEIALVQTGAGIDVGVVPAALLTDEGLQATLEAWPRLDFKRALLETLQGLFHRNPAAATSPIVADAALHGGLGYRPINFCEMVAGASFAE